MQILNGGDWPERSLTYLCRAFDNLNEGQDYNDIMSAIHIGILDFTLFPECPEFYAHYAMKNIINNNIYSDKFLLNVLDLNQTCIATEGDITCGLQYWARLFKAKTWEELKMLTKENEYLQEAAESLYVANADEIVRQQCVAREDAERRERTLERDKRLLQEALDESGRVIQEKDKVLEEKDKEIARLKALLVENSNKKE